MVHRDAAVSSNIAPEGVKELKKESKMFAMVQNIHNAL